MAKKILVIFILFALIYAALTWWGRFKENDVISSEACKLVTKIMVDGSIDNVSCEKVDLTKKVSPTFYQGKAYLSTGKVTDIGVKVSRGRIEVSMSP